MTSNTTMRAEIRQHTAPVILKTRLILTKSVLLSEHLENCEVLTILYTYQTDLHIEFTDCNLGLTFKPEVKGEGAVMHTIQLQYYHEWTVYRDTGYFQTPTLIHFGKVLWYRVLQNS